MPETLGTEPMDSVRELLARTGQLHLQPEIERLLELRQARYSADRRMIVEHSLEHGGKGPRLRVASLDPDHPRNRPRP